MASNRFGKYFTLTTAGESHGPAYVGIIDGVSSNFPLDLVLIQQALDRRAPGKSAFTTKRKEPDQVEFLSGIYEGKTTGAPIAFMVPNLDARSVDYQNVTKNPRPGHADQTYLEKYQNVDLRGGGRASGRETLCRVVAGAIAQQFCGKIGIDLIAAVQQIHTIRAPSLNQDAEYCREQILQDPLGCIDQEASLLMQQAILKASEEGDSLGGSIAFRIAPMMSGLGEPVYGKLTNRLADALMTIPAAKGVVFDTLDPLLQEKGSTFHENNQHAAGVLGGISTGETIVGEVFFKPPSSIRKVVQGRHDPVIVPRARVVVEAMLWITLWDLYLESRKCVI